MNNISVHNISKKYRLYHDKPMTLKERILRINDPSWSDFWALKSVSFSIAKGAVVGMIGRNGSGKSTLLKLISRILYPDSGSIEVKGRVSCLLELGAGFHPDFTGRENIYTNGAIFGLSRKEIDARVDDIIGFAELQDFIDSPVRTYSSGMYLRLGFSTAVHVDPDILLIDEILAVGDTNFQHKCFAKLQEFKRKGVTIVIVTHDTGMVERFCDQAFWLEEGKLENSGPASDVVMSYLEYMGKLEK